MASQGDGGCKNAEECIQQLINQGLKQNQNYAINKAIRLSIIHYRINVHGASVTYNPDNPDRGTTYSRTKIDIGSAALTSPGMLGSTIYHESIHIEQYLGNRHYDRSGPDGILNTKDDPLGRVGHGVNELEAYDKESAMKDYFGLSQEESAVVDQGRGSVLNFVPLVFMSHVYPSNGSPNYTMTGVTMRDIDATDDWGNYPDTLTY